MTNEEALAHFKNHEYMTDFSWQDEMSEVAISAIEKQIPKKPIPFDWEQYKDMVINAEYLRGGYWCPNCKHLVKSGDYCVDCGQALDWREE